MAITKKSDLNGLFNNIYERALFVAREMNVMLQLVTIYTATGYADRKIGQWAQLTAENVNEGVDYANGQKFEKTLLATLTPGEVMAQSVLTDVMQETDPDDAVRSCAEELGNAMATKIDTDIVGDFASFSTDVGPGASQTATLAKFGVGASILRNNKVMNPLYAVLHPYHWHDIWVELGQPASNKAFLGDTANQALRDFFVGSFLNMTWVVNANIDTDSGDDAVSGVFNPGALAFDSRKAPTMEPERDASLRAWELNMVGGYAHGVRRPTFGVKYTADAAQPS